MELIRGKRGDVISKQRTLCVRMRADLVEKKSSSNGRGPRRAVHPRTHGAHGGGHQEDVAGALQRRQLAWWGWEGGGWAAAAMEHASVELPTSTSNLNQHGTCKLRSALTTLSPSSRPTDSKPPWTSTPNPNNPKPSTPNPSTPNHPSTHPAAPVP